MAGASGSSSSLMKWITHNLVPPLFLLLFTGSSQYLAQVGNPERPFQPGHILGNGFAWKCILAYFGWAIMWLRMPGKVHFGPVTAFGLTPAYKDNGALYYFASTGAFLLLVWWDPKLCVGIYENVGPILGGLNVVAFSLCLFLLVRAKLKREEEDPFLRENKLPVLYEFYRGMELSPRLLGVDVKQLTNYRVGTFLWQLLPLVYLVADYELHGGVNPGLLVNALLQTLYVYKAFRWETGYFSTLDMTMDRAGYYLCWGTLVWIPAFYTFSSYYFVANRPGLANHWTVLWFILGVAAIWLKDQVDCQKELFRRGGQETKIWGRVAESIPVSYVSLDDGNKRKTSRLLTSGWWGVGRKMNYTFEWAGILCWSSVGGLQYGVWPFLCPIFVAGLLIHRVFRDEAKCKAKYGQGWEAYCARVPYRLIPCIF